MSTPEIPSKSPSGDGSLAAAFTQIFTKLMQRMDGQLPAEIVSYNRQTNRAMVRPLIDIISTSAERVGRAPIAAVPVLAMGGGGMFINFPLGPGDLGWIEASDRDISLFLQSAQQSAPNDGRIHSFEHGRFIPDVYDNFTFTLDAGAMVISTLDGSTRIVMSEGKIQFFASEIDFNSSTINVNNTGAMTINTSTYTVNTTGGSGSTTTGAVNLPVNTTINGRTFMGHTHSDPQGGNTGGVN